MKTLEEKRQYQREYMRKYNKTEKGKAYNVSHVKEYRKKVPYKPHGNRKHRSSEYREIIIDFLVRKNGLVCGFCGDTLENSEIHIDHIHPVALGGKNIMENLRLSHPKCNLAGAVQIRKQIHGY